MPNAWHWTGEEVVSAQVFTCGPGPIGPIPRGGFILCIGPPMLGCPSERNRQEDVMEYYGEVNKEQKERPIEGISEGSLNICYLVAV